MCTIISSWDCIKDPLHLPGTHISSALWTVGLQFLIQSILDALFKRSIHGLIEKKDG
jgi:hypothetical protein